MTDDDFYLPVADAPVTIQAENGNVTAEPLIVMCSICGAAVVGRFEARRQHKEFHYRLARLRTPEELSLALEQA